MTMDEKKSNLTFNMKNTVTGSVMCEALLENKIICSCKVNSNINERMWTIASWFTNEEFQGQGIGKQTLARTLLRLYTNTGIPAKIKYIWNGMNPYVLDWMQRHFDAECSCSVAVQKKQADDDWESHIYDLDVNKTLKYFGIK